MIFYPKGYFKKISEISLDYLNENNIKGIILDVDNTLIDYYRNMEDETIEWVNNLKQNGIKMCILSNSGKKEKVKKVAEKLDLEYSYLAMKPLKRGFKKAQKKLQLECSEIAAIGDQIFTDVLGANRMKMHSILVEPRHKKDIFITLINRPIEKLVKRKYLTNKVNNKENVNTLKQYKTDTINLNRSIEKNNLKIKKDQREEEK